MWPACDTWPKCWCWFIPDADSQVSILLLDLWCLFPASTSMSSASNFQLWSVRSASHLMRCVWGGDWRWWGEYWRLTFLCHLTSHAAHVSVARTGGVSSEALYKSTQTLRGDKEVFPEEDVFIRRLIMEQEKKTSRNKERKKRMKIRPFSARPMVSLTVMNVWHGLSYT